jgi:23S rRNA pseudouridine1911/1915/1917 synthase
VDKPAGLPVRRSHHTDAVTLPQILAGMYPDYAHVGGVNRAGVVTTLGDDVSGPVLAGKHETAYRDLRRLQKRQYVEELYSALVEGNLRDAYTIDQPIGNAKHARGRLMVAREGRAARTHVRPQQHYRDAGQVYTLVELRPESSRMHQMRVHLAWYGFPIVGDRLYGSKRQTVLPDRLFLHLSRMTLEHPETGEQLRVDSPLPAELYSILSYMRRPK